jgi:hypothetical protein
MSQREYRHDHDPRSSADTTSGTPGKVTSTSRVQRREASAPPPPSSHEAPTADRHALQDQGLARAMGFVDEPPRVVQRAAIQRRERRDPTDDPNYKGPRDPNGVRGPDAPPLDAPHDVKARIQEITIVRGKTHIRLSKGTDHGVFANTEGHQIDPVGQVLHFWITHATETAAYADVDAIYDLVQNGNPIVTVNPSSKPSKR